MSKIGSAHPGIPSAQGTGGSDAAEDPNAEQPEAAVGGRRSSRQGANGSSDLFLAYRLQQEEYWAMHRKPKKGASKHLSSSAAPKPLKRAFDSSIAATISAQSSPRSSTAETGSSKKTFVGPAGQRSVITRPSGDVFGDLVSSSGSDQNLKAEFDLHRNKELDRVALLLLALQECCDDLPSPQVSEDSAIFICPSAGPSGTELSFRLSPFESQCRHANEISTRSFKAPIASSIADLRSVVLKKLGPCAASGEVQFFVRGLLLSKFVTLRDAHSLWTVVFCGVPMTLHFRGLCTCAGAHP